MRSSVPIIDTTCAFNFIFFCRNQHSTYFLSPGFLYALKKNLCDMKCSVLWEKEIITNSLLLCTDRSMQNEVGLGVERSVEDVILEMSFKR